MKYTEEQINNIVDIIVKGYNPEKVYLYGSYANFDSGSASDIDILVIKETNERFYKRPINIHNMFNPYVYDIDVHVYTPDEFDKYSQMINTIPYLVSKNGRLLYE